MPADPDRLLRQYFGYESFRPGQREAIVQVLEGTSTLALFPTGAGKSICYQLPALALPGLTIVVSPLLALMHDQLESLRLRQIPATKLDSTLDEETTAQIHRELANGQHKLVFLSPERLTHPPTLEHLRQLEISLIAIDESHCFSRWGQSFRPDYRRLPGLIRRLKPACTLALTATASPAVARDIRQGFKIKARDEIRLPMARPNLSWHVTPAAGADKLAVLTERLRAADALPAVIYCTRQATTVDVAGQLQRSGLDARAYHAGIPADSRAEILDAFLRGDFPIIVATIAFGMGVDKPDIRSVFHYEVPRSPEAWVQEAGRAGRDGSSSRTEVLPAADDFQLHRTITLAHHPTATAIERIVSRLFTGERDVLISPYQTTTDVDVSRQVLDTILIYLEIDRIIERRAIFHRKLRISLLRPLASILQPLTAAQKRRAKDLLGTRGWLDLLPLANTPRELGHYIDLVNALEAAEDIRVTRSHQLHFYRISSSAPEKQKLVERFATHFEENLAGELERLATVEGILTSRRCISRNLLSHLGEKNSPDCGNCSRCQGERLTRKLPASKSHEIDHTSMEAIQHLVAERLPALQAPQQLARHLLGINSPAAQATRLYRRGSYGLLADHGYEEVRALAEAML